MHMANGAGGGDQGIRGPGRTCSLTKQTTAEKGRGGGISVDAVVRQLGANCAVRPSLAATISGKLTPSLRKKKRKNKT